MGYNTLSVAKEGPLGVVTINRPDALNALNRELVGELIAALTALEADEEVRCLVITGSERAFSAGADINEMADMSAVEMVMTEHFFPLWDKVGRYPKPLVGALSGFVLGGGLELAMSLDVLIASETTQLGQPEINIGVIPGGGGTQRLTRAVGKYKAMEMVLTGARIGAEEAKALGLVSRVVPKEAYLEEAKKVAREIASKSPVSVKLAKMAVNRAFETGLGAGLDFERELFYLLFASEDAKEGMKAFLEKRKPVFKGK
ncbi:MAG: enoyl-CoA hydratase/isomerase family protein [Nitrososphaerota archaeon]|nr:enoyl-CoA hydratase/isomerase family protein [Nitrososphaerota archaeon]MDG6916785.1 enoyl-CoA hydratase/isomerase family protein [Nitrososphaerota archaeon]MDG6918873.1 enoyl-CoA hydratase/isomerase family protein [Nitrososphaerota archaeon]MDG6946511.1 enoyl-CoA hydratase/isomerase family protein [Nitrososphaerota archaeon]